MRHRGNSPVLGAFGRTGRIKNLEALIHAGFSRRTFQVRHTGYSPALAALGRTGRIKIVEAIMYAGFSRRTFQVRHRGNSPALAALGRTGRIKIVEVIIYAGRLGGVFFGAPGRYAYCAPYGVFSSTRGAWVYRARKNC